MAANISRLTKARHDASSGRSPMPRVCACSAAFSTEVSLARKRETPGQGDPTFLRGIAPVRVSSVRVPKAQVIFAAVPAAVVETLAHRVEIRDDRLNAQVDAQERHREIVVDLIARGGN